MAEDTCWRCGLPFGLDTYREVAGVKFVGPEPGATKIIYAHGSTNDCIFRLKRRIEVLEGENAWLEDALKMAVDAANEASTPPKTQFQRN